VSNINFSLLVGLEPIKYSASIIAIFFKKLTRTKFIIIILNH